MYAVRRHLRRAINHLQDGDMDPGDGGAAQGSGPQPEPSRQHQLRNVPRRSRQHLESVRHCTGDLALLWIAWLVGATTALRQRSVLPR